jgi:hypothetical protein
MRSHIVSDTIYSVASLPLSPKAGLSSIINFLTIKNKDYGKEIKPGRIEQCI